MEENSNKSANNDFYAHNYTLCPLCSEPVSIEDKICKVCGKKLYNIDEKPEVVGGGKLEFSIDKAKLTSIIKKVIISFLIINISFFSINIYKNAYNKPNSMARTYLTTADAINYVYIFSLSDIFGYKNILTLPFYSIRDALYNKGMSLIPTNDGEREMWWWEIRFMEFNKYVFREQMHTESIHGKPTLKGYLGFKKWEEEIYSHIEPFARADVKGTEYSKEKYVRFITMSDSYVTFATGVFLWLDKHYKPLYIKELLIKYPQIYQTYEDYKKYASTFEKDGFDYFNNDPEIKVNELLFVNDISFWILEELCWENILTCDNKFINIYADNQFKIYDYFEKYHKTMSSGRFVQLSIAKTLIQGLEPIENKCKNNGKFVKFIDMRNKEVNRHY